MDSLIVVVYVTLGLTGVVLPLIAATLLAGHPDHDASETANPRGEEPPATA